MNIEEEAQRNEQSNDIAYMVIEVAQNKAPSEFVTLDFRYGIADALWDAGYRKVEQADQEPSDAEALAALNAQDPLAATDDLTDWGSFKVARMRAALIAAQEVRRG